jgi:hypothetical protein
MVVKKPTLDMIPLKLRRCPQWVCWRAIPKPDGKADKIPVNPRTGGNAMSDNPQTFGEFTATVKYFQNKKADLAGVGFVFTKNDPFAGIDLDNCRDKTTGEITDSAKAILDSFRTYCEVSPSGTGIKLFLEGKLPGKGISDHARGIEIYDAGRFFTVTGDWVRGYPSTIESRNKELLDLYKSLSKDNGNSPCTSRNPIGWQDDLLKGVGTGSRHRTALRLAGRWAEKGHSDSEIVQFIIAWNQNNVPRKVELSDPNSKEMQDIINYVRGKHAEPEAPSKDPLVFPRQLLTGAAGAFAQTYAEHLEVPAHFLWVSYLTCVGSAVSGLVTLESEIKPSTRVFALLLGESADDRKSTAIAKTVNAFKEWVHEFASCWGIGSAEGLQKLMVKNSNLLLVFDEFKQFVSKCKIDGSILLPCVNSLFENTWYESHTSKSDINLNNAHLSLLAASTVQTYERIWDSTFLDIGLPNRLFLVPGKGERRFSIPSKVGNLPGLKNDLAEVLRHVGKLGEYPITQEARGLYHNWYMSLEPSAHTKRLDTYALRFMVLLTANELKMEVDAKTVQDVITLMDWQLAVRQALDPIDADNRTARLEEKIRRALAKGNLLDRNLKQIVHANREGLWAYQVAMRNLREAKEIVWNKDEKKWHRN